MYISNNDTQITPSVETFGHSTKWPNQSKFNKSLQGCFASEKENFFFVKLWGLV